MSKVNNSSAIEPSQQTINTSANIDANQKYGFIMGKLHLQFRNLHTVLFFLCKQNSNPNYKNYLQASVKIH